MVPDLLSANDEMKELTESVQESLLDVIAEDIVKNEYNSLILIDYE